MSKLFPLLSLMISAAAFAEEHGGGHGDPHHIPWGTIGIQAFNIVLLLALLVYLLRALVVAHFKERRATYTELVERAQAAKTAAEASHREISQKLQSLQQSADESLRTAQTEAAAIKQKMMTEAQALAKKLEEDAHRSAELEIEKAKSQLRAELLAEALNASREALKKTVGSTDSQRLQSEFADKIQVVGQ